MGGPASEAGRRAAGGSRAGHAGVGGAGGGGAAWRAGAGALGPKGQAAVALLEAARGGRRGGRTAAWGAAALVGALLSLVVLILSPLLLLFGGGGLGAQIERCETGTSVSVGGLEGPGSLGGVMGTGIGIGDHQRVLSHARAGDTLREGGYLATAYGPPWGGINGPGEATAGGIPIGGGAPRHYMVAVDPRQISLGQLVYVWPNPFGWKGPFMATDTGGAIVGRRIDFYDWRGVPQTLWWGVKSVRVGRNPRRAGIPPPYAGGIGGRRLAVMPAEEELCLELVGSDLALPGPMGRVTVHPATLPPQPLVMSFARRMAHVAGRPLVITSGRRPGSITTTGNVSEHSSGMAADFGDCCNHFSEAEVRRSHQRPLRERRPTFGDRIAAAAFVVAGVERRRAMRLALRGGTYSVCAKGGLRVQVLWRTWTGGNHWNHPHVGLRPGGCGTPGSIHRSP